MSNSQGKHMRASAVSWSRSSGALCAICKTLREKEEASQCCDCFYHHDCLREWVNKHQQSSCHLCGKNFSNCRITKKRLPFTKFLCTPEVSVALSGALLVLLFLVYFFLIVFSEYTIVQASNYPKLVQLLILIPGCTYVACCVFFCVISCVLLKQQYHIWCVHNYTLVM